MKKLVLVLVVGLLGFSSFGQNVATNSEVISKEKKGNIDVFITSAGDSLKVGDTITLGVAFRNEQFDYVQQNAGVAVYPLTNMASGSKIIIKGMRASMRVLTMRTTKPQGLVYGLYVVNVQGAIDNGELKIDSNILSSDEALIELKRSKDKLDLGLITQEEFDAKKAELSPFIK